MGFRFRKSVKIAPGIRLNIGKKGITSISAGTKGARVSVSKKGTRTTISAPGTGLSYSSYKPHNTKNTKYLTENDPDPSNFGGHPTSEWIIAIIVGIVIFFTFIFLVS